MSWKRMLPGIICLVQANSTSTENCKSHQDTEAIIYSIVCIYIYIYIFIRTHTTNSTLIHSSLLCLENFGCMFMFGCCCSCCCWHWCWCPCRLLKIIDVCRCRQSWLALAHASEFLRRDRSLVEEALDRGAWQARDSLLFKILARCDIHCPF